MAAAAAAERRTEMLGGKGSSLSSASVFAVGRCNQVRVDASALSSRLSSSSDRQKQEHCKFLVSIPGYFSLEEARAGVLVLLRKLLLTGLPSFSPAASQLSDALNGGEPGTEFLFPELSIDIAYGDLALLNSCWSDAALQGICALLDYRSSTLSTIADAAASISCEAVRADVLSAFNSFTDSGDGSSDKDCVAVAGDFKVFLNGSKMIGNTQCDQVSNIPKIHGRLRYVSRTIHSATRVELNSPPSQSVRSGEDLATVLAPLAPSLRNLGKASWLRLKLCLDDLLASNSLFSSLMDSFNSRCPSVGSLDESYQSFQSADLANDYKKSFHHVYEMSETVRQILSWELIVSLISLEGIELFENLPSKKEDNGESAKAHKKRDKQRKIVGKGTSVLIQFIKDALHYDAHKAVDISEKLSKFLQDFLSFLNLHDPRFELFLQKVKDVVHCNERRRLPKLPKGTRDFAKEQMAVREKAFSIIGEVFKRHGAMALDTPVFELRETLTGKYGEDSKLIYDLADQGGELCSLRYDLTVPFARYVATNGLTSFRRYQIAKVYRRDNPSKGRYREFYQCDFDIAGDETVGADFEVVKILTELLDELNIGEYEIKLNHRKLLDGMLDICGVPLNKVRTICSSIDKLDKQSFEQIKREMVDEKGLKVETADEIGSFVLRRGSPAKLLSELKKEGSKLLENDASNDALMDLEKLFKALENARCIDKVVLDLSLARGLDYYTGVIFEAVFKGTTEVGSIAAGGRYDNLIGMFGTKHVPAVGVSLGIERVFTIMEQLQLDQNQAARATETQVLVSVVGDDMSLAAKLVSECWDAKLKAEYMVHRRVTKHFDRAKESKIPLMAIVGERELSEGTVRLKDMVSNKEVVIPATEFVEELARWLNN